MAETNPNPENQEAAADLGDAEGLDAAALAFAQQSGDVPNTDPEPESDPEPEAEEAEPAEEETRGELKEVEYEGKTYEVPPELEKALLRQSDYSRRMNEVGAKEKAYETRLELIEGMEKVAEKRAESLAVVKQIDAQIKQYEGIDWAKAEQENPSQAALWAVKLMTLQQQKAQAEQTANGADAEFRREREKLRGEQAADMAKVLDKELPNWRGEAGVKLTQYATEKGIPAEQLGSITNPALILALEKARKYDELQASKPALKEKAKSAPPVVKSGAPRRTDNKTEAMAKLRKNGSLDAATEAFLSLG